MAKIKSDTQPDLFSNPAPPTPAPLATDDARPPVGAAPSPTPPAPSAVDPASLDPANDDRASPEPTGILDISARKSDAPIAADEALRQLQRWGDLSSTQYRDLSGSVRAAVRVSGMPATSLLLSAVSIREHVVAKPLAVWGDGNPRKRRSNVLSGLRRVLERLGVIDKEEIPIAEHWHGLREQLDQRRRMSLAAFMDFATLYDIAPADVGAQTIDWFRAWLEHRTIIKQPAKLAAAARRAWNQAAGTIDGWPGINLPLNPQRKSLTPFAAYPDSFRDDLDRLVKRLEGEDAATTFGFDHETDDERARAPRPLPRAFRETTITTKLQHVRTAADALHRSGVPALEITSLRSLVHPVRRASQIIQHLWTANGRKTSPTIGHVAEMLRQIGKFHAPIPEDDLDKLTELARKCAVRYRSMTQRNRTLLEQLKTPERLLRLWELPRVLFDEAARETSARRAASLALRGVVIALLLRCPMRLANLLHLNLLTHLVRPDPKQNQVTAILIPGEQTKNGEPLAFPVPEDLAELIDRWITDYRPLIASSTSPFLFPGTGDKPMTRPGMREAIKSITAERIGVAINPHAFRHLAAYVYLNARPGAYEGPRQLLGHRDLRTTTRAYVGFEAESAFRDFDAILKAEVESLGLAQPEKRPRRTRKPKVSTPPKRPAAPQPLSRVVKGRS